MIEDNNKPIGYIFDNIAFFDENQLELLIDDIDEEKSHIMINFACQKAISSGIFNNYEIEILLKSLRKFNSGKK